ncbi:MULTISPECIES: histidinol-phosphate transaminase [Methanobacterium]|jgi:histidinol-phosphate aminotransferase|uniref:Histidinol-phosphate aminotransferase n=1 Tax=Methanobacterium veterum TaxID=408577 RepID=A0A9E5A6W7_9EURY|nr:MULTISPECIES: histidinol-phosphate transaminase [Methanobacterium]MCZ3364968.1 histidinol-phosphate transaminase [Methanobacterium veterum]MCZ3372723.1 histidinol-phosphate transaminase [Methanobacterium veterum]
MVKVKETVKKLDPYVPGKSIPEIAQKYNLDPETIIKLGSNENPLGPSEKSMEAIKESLQLISQYPETNLEPLKEKLALYSGVDSSNIIIGGDGADEILDVLGKTLIEPGDEFIVPLPSYMYYEFTLKIHGGVPVYARWDMEKNELDVDSIIAALSEKTKIIFLCTPNNPSGTLIDKRDIKRVLESTDALVVADEAYFEFSEVNNVDLIKDYDNLLLLRTFSKVFGLSGMRIGYAISNPEFIEYMHRVKPVFSLTKLSYEAASAVLDDKEYIQESIEIGIQSREFLYENMSKFDKLDVYPSKSNYLLVGVKETGMTSSEFAEELLKRGVIVRDCASFKGLDEYWVRVSVGTMEEDARFIEILADLIG